MPDPLAWPINTVTDTKVAVATATTVVLAANPGREDAVFVCDRNQPI